MLVSEPVGNLDNPTQRPAPPGARRFSQVTAPVREASRLCPGCYTSQNRAIWTWKHS